MDEKKKKGKPRSTQSYIILSGIIGVLVVAGIIMFNFMVEVVIFGSVDEEANTVSQASEAQSFVYNQIPSVSIAPDQEHLVVNLAYDIASAIRFYDVVKNEYEIIRPTSRIYDTVAYHPDGERILLTSKQDDTVEIYDLEEKITDSTFIGYDVATFSHDGETLVIGNDAGEIKFISLVDNSEEQVINIDVPIHAIAYAPDETWIAVVLEHDDELALERIDLDTLSRTPLFFVSGENLIDLIITPDSQYAIVAIDNNVQIIDKDEPVQRFYTASDTAQALIDFYITPDGQQMVLLIDGRAYIYDYVSDGDWFLNQGINVDNVEAIVLIADVLYTFDLAGNLGEISLSRE